MISSAVYHRFHQGNRGTIKRWYYTIYVGRISSIRLRSWDKEGFATEWLARKAAERAVKRIHKET